MKIFSECLVLISVFRFPKLFSITFYRPFSASCLSSPRLIFLKNCVIIIKKTFSFPRIPYFVKNLTKYFRQINLRITTNKTFPNLVKILTISPPTFSAHKKNKRQRKKDAARVNLTTSLTILLILFFCNSYFIRPFPLVVWFIVITSIANKPYSAFYQELRNLL